MTLITIIGVTMYVLLSIWGAAWFVFTIHRETKYQEVEKNNFF